MASDESAPKTADTATDRQPAADVSAENHALIGDFVEDVESDKATSTMVFHYSNLSTIAAQLDTTALDELTKDDAEEIIGWLKTQDYGRKTIQNYMSSLTQFLRWADEHDLAEYLKEQKPAVDLSITTISEPEIYRIIRRCPTEKYRALFEFLWLTGMRASKCLELERGDIGQRNLSSENYEYRDFCVYPLDDRFQDHESAPTFWTEQAPYFLTWYESLASDTATLPLWPRQESKEPLKVSQIRYQLEKAASNADIETKVTLKKIRQSRAIHLVYHDKVTSVERLRRWFGWSSNTQTAKQYWEFALNQAEQDDQEWHYCPNCEAALQASVVSCYRCDETINIQPESETAEQDTVAGDLTAKLEMLTDEVHEMNQELRAIRQNQHQFHQNTLELLQEIASSQSSSPTVEDDDNS